MWYEILPSAGILFAVMMAPAVVKWGSSKLFNNGKSSARHWEGQRFMDYHAFLRDQRVSGSEYVPKGLEALPGTN